MKIGIDLGGTNIAGGLVSDDGRLIYKTSTPTVCDKGEEGLCLEILKVINALLAHEAAENVTSIGIGVPGHVDEKEGLVVICNNIPFKNTPLANFITEKTSLPCYLGNDANAAALGEVLAGCAKDYNDAVMITLGTGVGSGLIFGKKIFAGCNGAAGEIGHISLFPDGIECNCGRRGCFELYASATALKNQTREAMEKNPESALWKFAKNLDEVNGKTAFDAMRDGDKVGSAVVSQYIRYLSIGVLDIINLLFPEAIIFGGGISKEGENLLAPLREIIDRECYSTYGKKPALLIAELGNDAGIIGAAFFGV